MLCVCIEYKHSDNGKQAGERAAKKGKRSEEENRKSTSLNVTHEERAKHTHTVLTLRE
jgi:hypothetical protein